MTDQGEEGRLHASEDGLRLLAAFAAFVWKARRAIAAGAVVGLLVGAAWAVFRPKQYMATVIAMPPASDNKLGSLSALAMSALPSLSLDSPQSGTQQIVAILESRHLHGQLIEQGGVKDDYDAPSRDQRLDAFAEDFKVAYDPINGRISWSFRNPDPAKAAAVATKAVELLKQRMQELVQSGLTSERAFLERQALVVEGRLKQAYARRAEFLAANNVIDVDAQVRTTIEALADLQARRLVSEIELRSQQASGAGADNSDAVHLKATIDAIDAELARYLEGGAGEKREGLLVGLKGLPAVTIAYLDMLREIKIQETVSAQLTAQVESVRIQEARSASGVTIIDPALVPDRPIGPPRPLLALLVCMLGAVLGFAAYAIRYFIAGVASQAWKRQSPASTP